MIRNDEELKKFYREGTPVTHPDDSLLSNWTARLRGGERGKEADGIARYIIKDFRLRQLLGVPQSSVTLEWLGEALGEILNYADPLETLGLMRRPSKRPADPQKGWDVACWVSEAMRRGYAKEDAIKEAAKVFFTDATNVRRHIKRRPEWMNASGEVWDEYFKLRQRPLPQPIDASKK